MTTEQIRALVASLPEDQMLSLCGSLIRRKYEQEGAVTGRRVDDTSKLEQPGDYAVLHADDGSVSGLWFILPDGSDQGRIAAEGHGHRRVSGGVEPEWKIVEEHDGSVTVEPSIDCGDGGWHGHLQHGVWSYP